MTRIHHRFSRMKFSLIAAIAASWLLVVPMAMASGHNSSGTGNRKADTSPAQIASSVDAVPRILLESGDIMDPPALDNAHQSGAGGLRVTVKWTDIEPSNTDPSHYHWTSTDNRLNAIASRGLAPLVVVL